MSFDGDLYPTAGATSVMTTKGDMVDYDTARQRLGIGSANQILQVKSSLPSWQTVPLADTVLTTAGDVLYEDATPALARLGAGTQYNNLQMGASLPAWQPSATSVMSTTGDLLYASGANTLARLAGGTSGDVLTANGAGVAPSYQTPSAGGGGNYVFLESFTATASSAFTCTFSSPIAIGDFSMLVGCFNGKYSISHPSSSGALALQIADNLATPLTVQYVNRNCVTNASGVSSVDGGTSSFHLCEDTTDAGSIITCVFEYSISTASGDGGGNPSDACCGWRSYGTTTSNVGGGKLYHNTGSITTVNGFYLSNVDGYNFEAGATLDVWKVTT